MSTEANGPTDASPQPPGMRALLRVGSFRRLLIGQAVSALGDWVGTVAFIAAALALTGSPFAVGSVLVIRLVPPLFAAPLGGVLADRMDRRTLMVGCNVAQGALIALVPFVGIWLLYVIAFANEFFAILFLPARDATVPELVPPAALPQANGLIMASSYGAIPFAFALFSGLRLVAAHVPAAIPFGGILRSHPLAAPFFFDAATFAFSAVMLAGIRTKQRVPSGQIELLSGALEGFRYLWRKPVLRACAVGVGVAMFGGGVLFALGIAFVHETLGAGDVEFGFLASLWGLGMAVGLGAVRLIARRGEGLAFRAAVTACGAILIVMALVPILWLSYAAAVVFGLSFSLAIMLALSLAQDLVEDEIRGRLLGAVHMLFRGGLALGALGIGGLASALGSVSPGIGSVRVRLDGNQVGLVTGGAFILLGALAARRASTARIGRRDGSGEESDPG